MSAQEIYYTYLMICVEGSVVVTDCRNENDMGLSIELCGPLSKVLIVCDLAPAAITA